MNKLLNFLPFILREAPDAGGGGSMFKAEGGDTTAPAGDAGEGTPPSGDGTPPSGEGTPPEGGTPERPDWLMDKYKSPEDQAKAYKDLYGRFSKKTDDLRAEVLGDAVKEYGKTIGVPETSDAYEYPENIVAPGENLDKSLRDWSHKHNVSPDGFKELINDVWGKTLPNPEAEMKALGDHGEQRLEHANKWLNANVKPDHFGVVEKIMTTAAGVDFIESLMGDNDGFSPEDGYTGEGKNPSTRDEIREAQADERFGTDEEYTKWVRGLWSKFAAGGGKK